MISKRDFKAVEKMLYNYPKLNDSIRQIELDIEAVKNEYNTYRSFDYTKDKLSRTNSTGNEIEDLVIRKEKIINKLYTNKKRLEIEREKLDIAINNFTTEQKEIFEDRYIKLKSLQEIVIDRKMGKNRFYKLRDSIIYSTYNSINPKKVVAEVEARFKQKIYEVD
ncbi:hypothetical protein SAMN05216454_11436 [Peptostreptococcus russellii]|uniref:Phage protein n=1 Tax=Peptostreptococcus russellii TaxID=215200 RepID=A0A1H8JJL3_9FIRM|nr:hypothetical protein [Peptostreptococcus russellii]SEN80675.1 hypothetical protein SAMN05216454_11436 [Peptostreptococcus russellii]